MTNSRHVFTNLRRYVQRHRFFEVQQRFFAITFGKAPTANPRQAFCLSMFLCEYRRKGRISIGRMPLNDSFELSIVSINLDAASFPPSAPRGKLSFLC